MEELTQKTISKQTYFIALSVLIATISLAFAVKVGWDNANLMEKQHILIDEQLKSISPLKPTIEVSIDYPHDRKVAVWEIARINNYQDGNQGFGKKKIIFILSNIGRMRTGPINSDLKSNFTYSPNEHIDNIVGESSEFLESEIWYDKCWSDVELSKLENGTEVQKYVVRLECDYKLGEVPLGWHEFNLTLDCPFCSEKEKVYPFDFCIYGGTDISRKVCENETQAFT